MKEKIAIVGCGVKVPGADTLDEYWNLLERGENHVTEIPLSRWNHEAYYSKDRQAAGKTHAKHAGLLKDPLAFDNDLFNISDIEADQVDPQQRYVLECVYRAMEDGGFTKEQLKAQGNKVGVYVGAMNNDYRGQFNASQSASIGTTVTGTYNTVIAARVSFVFDFRGPSMTIDTACSSALVAVHLGVQALRTGDCDMAVCGGTNSTLTPDVFIHIGKAGMASRKGQCSTFSDTADGYVRGEGSAIVILKRLSDVSERDKVWAVIDTACNHDGGSVKAIPQPSEKQQYELLETIYAQVDPDTIQYIEAHGTGTSAGDRAEVNALGKFFSAQKSQVHRYIGAVKPNIGHLESAAGTASLIKVLLMMKHSKIVPTLLFGNLNPKIDFEGMKLTVPTAVVEWPNQKKESCLNSFGVGGTNCHAVIHSHNRLMALQNGHTIHSINSHIVCFSGKSQQSLTGCIEDFLSYPGVQNLDIHNVSYTSTVGREHYKCRQAFVVSSIEELMYCLRGHLSASSKAPKRLTLRAQQTSNIIFVFSGMSSDWVGMGVEMMNGSREFRIAIQDIDQILSKFVDWSLEARLSTETDQKDLNFWPIAIFAVQIGLARLWESLGIVPDSVIGYSMGEVAAAHVAGYLSLKDAVKVIYSRTKVLAELENNGRMIVVKNMPTEVVKDLLKDFVGKAVVSAEISPVCCAISGKADHIAQVQKALLEKVNDENQRIDIISLPVSVAYHSHCVDPCKERLAQMLEDVSPREPKVKMISTVSGQFINSSKDEKLDKTYWVHNMRESIKFLDAVKNSLNSGQDNIYVEIGPKPFMGAHVKDISPDTVLQTIPSMVKKGGLETFLKAVSHVYQNGCIVRWQNVPGFLEGQEITPVPRYCFQPRRYLHCSEGTFVTLHGIDLWKSSHPFVYKMQMCDVYKVMLSEFTFPSVYDHRISSEIVVPGALYAEVGFAVAKYIHQTRDPECSLSVTFSKMCHLETEKPLYLDVEVSKGELKHEKTGDLNVVLTKDNITLASIRVHQQSRTDIKRAMSIPEVNDRCCTQLNKSEISQVMKSWGFRYGPNYSLLTQARIGDQECLAEMHFPSSLLPEMLGTTMHPSITDAMLQTGLILLNEHETTSRDVFPTSIGRLTCFKATSNEMFVHTRATRSVGNMSVFDMRLLSKHGETIALIEDMVLTRLTEQDAETFAKSTWVPLVRNYIRKLKVLPTSTDCVKYGNNGTSIGDIKAVLNDMANKSSGQDFLVVYGDISIDDVEGCVSIQSKVLNACKLLKEIFTNGFKKRIYFFTKWGISINDVSSSVNNFNPIMTALWGFTGCALKEVAADIVILDLHLPEDTCSSQFITSLANFIHQDGSLSATKQWVVTEDALFTHEVIPWQLDTETVPSLKEIFADQSRNLIMVSQDEHSFSIYHDQKRSLTSHDVLMNVTETGSLNQYCFNIALSLGNLFSSSLQLSKGNAVFAEERVGKVQDGSDIEYISCYPSITCSKLKVPHMATIKKDLFYNYCLGDLSKLVVLYSLCQSATKDSVTIIVSPSTLGLGKLLKFMCEADSKDNDINLISEDKIGDANAPKKLKKNIISLVKLETNTISHIAKVWLDAERLVTVTALLQDEDQAFLRFLIPTIEIIQLNAATCFHHSNVLEVTPKISAWMTKNIFYAPEISKFLKSSDASPIKNGIPHGISDLLRMTKIEFNTSKVNVTQDQMFHKQAVYIVVGGLTGLGWMFVEFLAKHGAGNIAIMNRRKASDTDKIAMAELSKQNGCTIESFQADVTQLDLLKGCMASIEKTFKNIPLRGVFFGAAVLKDQLLYQVDWKDFEHVISAKIMGSWNMHQLTKSQDLDFFVCHSSVVSSVLGNTGQSSYATGNAFLDGLAFHRRHMSLAGQSINWGPLDTGMLDKGQAGTNKKMENLMSGGFVQLTKEEIDAAIAPTLLLNKAQTMQCKLDFMTFGMKRQNGSSGAQGKEEEGDQELNDLLRSVSTLSEAERINAYEGYIISLVTLILGERANGIQSKSNLRDYGLDSMLAMTLLREIKRKLKCDLHAPMLLGDPTPRMIAEEVNEMLHNEK